MKTEVLQLRLVKHQKNVIRLSAKRAGLGMSEWIIRKLFNPADERFVELLQRLAKVDEKNRTFVLAELNNFLVSLSQDLFTRAVHNWPDVGLGDFLSNYVAAMVETRAHVLKVRPPAWIDSVEALPKPVFGTSLISLRLYLLRSSPCAFRRRNIFIDATVGDSV